MIVQKNSLFSFSTDKLGIALSMLCLIHCLLSPLVLMFTPWLGNMFDSLWAHLLFLVLLLPPAYISFYHAWKRHSFTKPLILGSYGILFLCFGLLNEHYHWIHLHLHNHNHGYGYGNYNFIDEILIHSISMMGSLFLIRAHWINWKYCRCHGKAH